MSWETTTGCGAGRSAEVVRSRVMEALVWMRLPGDVVFALGAVLLAGYALRLLRRPATQAAPRASGRTLRAIQPGHVAEH